MPTYEIKSPDGSVYRIDAPDGKTEADALAYVKANHAKLQALPVKADDQAAKWAAAQSPRWDYLGDTGRAFSASASALGRDVGIAMSPKEPVATGSVLGDIVSGAKTQLSNSFAPTRAIGDVAGMISAPLTGAIHSVGGSALSYPLEWAGEAMGAPPKDVKAQADSAMDVATLGLGPGKASSAAPATVNALKQLRPVAQQAHDAGYVLPPQMISEKPGIVANTLAGWSGKIKTAQAASEKNQEVTNRLAATGLDLAPDTDLTPKIFKDIRSDAGKAYTAVIQAIPNVDADSQYLQSVSSLGGSNSQAATFFPNITKNQPILDLVDELKGVQSFPTEAGVELVKELRSNAVANLKAPGDPSRHALGLAQREAAEHVDSLIERNIAAKHPNTNLVDDYRRARQKIAKSYDVEGVTNPATGDVNAAGLAKLMVKGRPLTGDLKTIADVGAAFPKATQKLSAVGGNEPLSALDFFGSALAVGHGHPSVAAAILGRPIARSAVLSKTFQDMLFAQPAIPRAPGINLLKSIPLPAIQNTLSRGSMNALNAMSRSPPPVGALQMPPPQAASQPQP